MSDLLQTGANWLRDTMETSASQSVTYSRGSSSVTLTATFGHSLLKVADGHNGVRVVRTDRDFIIRSSAIDFGSGPVLPRRGDTIVCKADDGTTNLTYVVAAPRGEPDYRSCDPYGVSLRIHAKLLSGNAVAPY